MEDCDFLLTVDPFIVVAVEEGGENLCHSTHRQQHIHRLRDAQLKICGDGQHVFPERLLQLLQEIVAQLQHKAVKDHQLRIQKVYGVGDGYANPLRCFFYMVAACPGGIIGMWLKF